MVVLWLKNRLVLIVLIGRLWLGEVLLCSCLGVVIVNCFGVSWLWWMLLVSLCFRLQVVYWQVRVGVMYQVVLLNGMEMYGLRLMCELLFMWVVMLLWMYLLLLLWIFWWILLWVKCMVLVQMLVFSYGSSGLFQLRYRCGWCEYGRVVLVNVQFVSCQQLVISLVDQVLLVLQMFVWFCRLDVVMFSSWLEKFFMQCLLLIQVRFVCVCYCVLML